MAMNRQQRILVAAVLILAAVATHLSACRWWGGRPSERNSYGIATIVLRRESWTPQPGVNLAEHNLVLGNDGVPRWISPEFARLKRERSRVAGYSPVLARKLRDPGFAAMAHCDHDPGLAVGMWRASSADDDDALTYGFLVPAGLLAVLAYCVFGWRGGARRNDTNPSATN